MTTLRNGRLRREARVGAAVVAKPDFTYLQAIPLMARTHQPIPLWFRAIFQRGDRRDAGLAPCRAQRFSAGLSIE